MDAQDKDAFRNPAADQQPEFPDTPAATNPGYTAPSPKSPRPQSPASEQGSSAPSYSSSSSFGDAESRAKSYDNGLDFFATGTFDPSAAVAASDMQQTRSSGSTPAWRMRTPGFPPRATQAPDFGGRPTNFFQSVPAFNPVLAHMPGYPSMQTPQMAANDPVVEARIVAARRDYARASKNEIATWLLWLCVGIVGGHRFYLGDYAIGVGQAVTVGFGGLWWLLDAAFLHNRIQRINNRIAWDIAMRYQVPVEAVIYDQLLY